MKTFEASLSLLRDKSDYPTVEVTVTHENFTSLPIFRDDLAPPPQADIITAIYAFLPMAFSQQVVSFENLAHYQITTAFGHQLVRDTFKSKVKSINFKVDPESKMNGFPSKNREQEIRYKQEPSFILNATQKTLDVVINLDYVLEAPKLKDWRVRFLDVLDILVPIACDETLAEHKQV